MSDEKIEKALTAEEWTDILRDSVPDPGLVPVFQSLPLPADLKHEFYAEPHRLAAVCLYGQTFGFTREDVTELRFLVDAASREWGEGDESHFLSSLADRIEALLPPE